VKALEGELATCEKTCPLKEERFRKTELVEGFDAAGIFGALSTGRDHGAFRHAGRFYGRGGETSSGQRLREGFNASGAQHEIRTTS